LFLSSQKASFINGATILIDGGFTQNWLPGW
jgi:NAD(P)-dependent dehydrogenase (short-subunit alcohol dehydrogenase family)